MHLSFLIFILLETRQDKFQIILRCNLKWDLIFECTTSYSPKQVLIEEMPVVSAEVALTRNSPGASKLAMTRKHVMKDVKAEETPAKTQAFGTFIPWKLQFVPPNNQVRKNWLECEHVPEDLETMEVVWKGIAHLKSVTGFIEWLQQNPKVISTSSDR